MRYDTRNRTSLSLRPNQSTTSMRPVLGRGEKGQDGSNVLPTDEAIADAIDTPGSETSTSLKASIDAALGDFEIPDYMRTIFIDDDLTTARPAGYTGALEWITTVVDGIPTHAQSGDKITEVASVPVPVTVWSDTFATDGALGNTEVGALPWVVLGSGYTAARASGKQVFTAATTSIGLAYVAASSAVDSNETVTFQTTISTVGTNHQAGVAFNISSLANHLALVRVSSGDSHYRLVKRVSSVYSTITTTGATWPVMTDGDIVKIDIVKATGVATFTINGVVAWTGTLTDYLTSMGNAGHYCGSSTSVAEMAYDAASMTTLVTS